MVTFGVVAVFVDSDGDYFDWQINEKIEETVELTEWTRLEAK